MKLDTIAEGLADHGLEAHVADPCCRECGFLSYARQELRAALKRARVAGVFAEQPGEAAWLTRHRIERPLSTYEDVA